jgi:hypothetical protein
MHNLAAWREWSREFDARLVEAQGRVVTNRIDDEVRVYADEGAKNRLERAQWDDQWIKVDGPGLDPIPASGKIECVMGHKVGRRDKDLAPSDDGGDDDDSDTDERAQFRRLLGTRMLLICHRCYSVGSHRELLYLMKDEVAATFAKDKEFKWPPSR